MDLIQAIEHAIDGNAVLFVGSGFSRSAKNLDNEHLKTGGELACFLGETCGLSASDSLSDVADFYVAKFGSTSLVSLLRRQFQVSELGPEHFVFGRIPWKRIYTTNYDHVVELAYNANKQAIVPISLEDNIRRVGERSTQCVHINGFVDDVTAETLSSTFKLTDTSYSSGTFADSAWAGQFRHDISAANAVLFVGYSAADLDIKRILLASPEGSRKTFLAACGGSPTLKQESINLF
ncbi:MAG: SIR2 family protein, partial [Acidobacteria bacterium]|nr:SIR2 family protein [Acidobacteriota bacterium]